MSFITEISDPGEFEDVALKIVTKLEQLIPVEYAYKATKFNHPKRGTLLKLAFYPQKGEVSLRQPVVKALRGWFNTAFKHSRVYVYSTIRQDGAVSVYVDPTSRHSNLDEAAVWNFVKAAFKAVFSSNHSFYHGALARHMKSAYPFSEQGVQSLKDWQELKNTKYGLSGYKARALSVLKKQSPKYFNFIHPSAPERTLPEVEQAIFLIAFSNLITAYLAHIQQYVQDSVEASQSPNKSDYGDSPSGTPKSSNRKGSQFDFNQPRTQAFSSLATKQDYEDIKADTDKIGQSLSSSPDPSSPRDSFIKTGQDGSPALHKQRLLTILNNRTSAVYRKLSSEPQSIATFTTVAKLLEEYSLKYRSLFDVDGDGDVDDEDHTDNRKAGPSLEGESLLKVIDELALNAKAIKLNAPLAIIAMRVAPLFKLASEHLDIDYFRFARQATSSLVNDLDSVLIENKLPLAVAHIKSDLHLRSILTAEKPKTSSEEETKDNQSMSAEDESTPAEDVFSGDFNDEFVPRTQENATYFMTSSPSLTEKKLTSADRRKMKPSQFAIPERRAWPISDEVHARYALIYIKQRRGNPDEFPRVIKAIRQRYSANKDLMALASEVSKGL